MSFVSGMAMVTLLSHPPSRIALDMGGAAGFLVAATTIAWVFAPTLRSFAEALGTPPVLARRIQRIYSWIVQGMGLVGFGIFAIYNCIHAFQ
jgi:hypothetical protein